MTTLKEERKAMTRAERNTKYRVLEKKDIENSAPTNKRARLIVRNLSFKSTEEKLKGHFDKFGEIHEVNILKHPDGKLVGCAFVQFQNVKDAEKAILELSGKEFLKRTIYIDWATAQNRFIDHLKMQIKNKVLNEDEIKVEPLDKDSEIKEEVDVNLEIKEDDVEDYEMSDDDDDDHDVKVKLENDDDNISKSEERIKSNDIDEGKTVFIKCIPMDATKYDFKKCCQQFGEVYYALLNVDSTGHSKGTGFVKFKEKESADKCLQSGTEFKLLEQILDPHPALSRNDINKKFDEKKGDVFKDSRNLYLVKEGLIMSGNAASKDVSASDMAMRIRLEQSKSQILKKFTKFISRERLVFHNIPKNFDDNMLRKMISQITGLKPIECRIMLKNTLNSGISADGKQFAFVSFKTHEQALIFLRKFNNNPNIFSIQSRPIIAFSVEDKNIHKIKQKRLEMSLKNNPTYQNKEQKKNEERKLRKLKKKLEKGENSNTINMEKNIKEIKPIVKKITKKIKHASRNLEDFAGATSTPGSSLKMRSFKKLKEQASEHFKNVHQQKKETKKLKEKREIRKEKDEIGRTKPKKKIPSTDNFSLLVDKYKQLLTKTEKPQQAKRSKWYAD